MAPLIPKGSATDGFAFPHMGTSFVKVRAFSHFGDFRRLDVQMSNVVRSVMRSPRGDDAARWEALKADKELARYYGIRKRCRWPRREASTASEQVSKLLSRCLYEKGVIRVRPVKS